MKIGSLIIAALAITTLSSCYVEVSGTQRHRHPFWHHRNRVVIHSENKVIQKTTLPIHASIIKIKE